MSTLRWSGHVGNYYTRGCQSAHGRRGCLNVFPLPKSPQLHHLFPRVTKTERKTISFMLCGETFNSCLLLLYLIFTVPVEALPGDIFYQKPFKTSSVADGEDQVDKGRSGDLSPQQHPVEQVSQFTLL